MSGKSQRAPSVRSSVAPSQSISVRSRHTSHSNHRPPSNAPSSSTLRLSLPQSMHRNHGPDSTQRREVYSSAMEMTVRHKQSLEIDKNGRHYPKFTTIIDRCGMGPETMNNSANLAPQQQAMIPLVNSNHHCGSQVQRPQPTPQEQFFLQQYVRLPPVAQAQHFAYLQPHQRERIQYFLTYGF